MQLIDVLKNLDQFSEDAVLYAKRINEQFALESDAVALDLTEEELEWKIDKVTEKKCPGFVYFREMYFIKEFMNEIPLDTQYSSFESKSLRLIHYVHFDA